MRATSLSPRQALTPAPYALALPGLWTQQNTTSPNLIGGYSGNGVTSGVVGATIGGGGQGNTVSNQSATVGGGFDPWSLSVVTNTASGHWSTVGGGWHNTASNEGATIARWEPVSQRVRP